MHRKDKKVFLQLRDNGSGKRINYPNMWCFPGGTKEWFETHKEAAIREIREEFDLKIDPTKLKLLHVYAHDDVQDDNVFVCDAPGEVRVLNEGAAFAWFSIDHISKNVALGFEQSKLLAIASRYIHDLS